MHDKVPPNKKISIYESHNTKIPKGEGMQGISSNYYTISVMPKLRTVQTKPWIEWNYET